MSTEEDRSKSVVLSKRIPEDFVENTLLPHLEAQLLDTIHTYTPAELAKIAAAYSKTTPRQYPLVTKLAETVVNRIVAFEAVDIVAMMGPMWVMAPGHDDMWEHLEDRILEKMDDFTVLNLIGVIRIFRKRTNGDHAELMKSVLPRLGTLLREYEAVELSDMLVSIAQSVEAAKDMDILALLVPEVERRYKEVSLVHAINNVWALTQLKVVHPRLLQLVANDLNTPQRVKDLTPAFMARIVWVYRRCNQWDMVSAAMLPMIKATVAEFKCGDFARLAQSIPDEPALLTRVADVLHTTLDEMGRKDFLLYFLGCVHGELLEVSPKDARDEDTRVGSCLEYIRDEQDNFKRDEVEKIVYLLRYSKNYQPLLEELPKSWDTTKEKLLDYIAAKA